MSSYSICIPEKPANVNLEHQGKQRDLKAGFLV